MDNNHILSNPTVGPVLGMVSKTEARFFAAINKQSTVQANDPQKPKLGYLIIWQKGDEQNKRVHRFRFNADFDYSGVIIAKHLTPNTCYQYQVGVCKNDEPKLKNNEIDSTRLLGPFTFSTAHDFKQDFSFAMGSCMRPGIEIGIGSKPAPSETGCDKVFAYNPNYGGGKPVSFQLLMGDQIYADPCLMLNRATSFSDYYKIYREVFNFTRFKKALASTPTIMLMDDHEVSNSFTEGVQRYQDNWYERWVGNDERIIAAAKAFQIYQGSHSGTYKDVMTDNESQSHDKDVGFIKGADDLLDQPTRWSYDFDWGDASFFITDTRMERTNKNIVSEEQLTDILAWLDSSKEGWKFIVSSVVFFPDGSGSDNWKHAADQRQKIIDHINTNKIKNVVFLSGDVHIHFGCTMTTPNGITITQLVSSGIFWPTYLKMFKWDKDDLKTGKQTISSCDIKLLKDSSNNNTVFEGNGIGRVDVLNDHLVFQVINRKNGKPVLTNLIDKV